MGRFPWGDDDAVTRERAYLGTVVENRLRVREHPAKSWKRDVASLPIRSDRRSGLSVGQPHEPCAEFRP